jgi:hypothetical protein
MTWGLAISALSLVYKVAANLVRAVRP